MNPSVGLGAKPQSSLHCEASPKRESGSEASPDSANASYHRREAEDGSLRDESLSGAWGKAPIVPPLRSIPKNENQEAKRPLIPLTPLITAAKRRWGLGMKSPSGFGWQPKSYLYPKKT